MWLVLVSGAGFGEGKLVMRESAGLGLRSNVVFLWALVKIGEYLYMKEFPKSRSEEYLKTKTKRLLKLTILIDLDMFQLESRNKSHRWNVQAISFPASIHGLVPGR
ncbi:hypothetical protein KFK09_016082 [Dendrobium nobile]|uniref:Uncharacterized protein n=1 Tax=Dendrobium nobile TaxID=94219 RepID=A0A8T3AXT0_DENNO|nr:hypothetical protein KFK09_016082 [Dendrobium nobile]